ncbi:hypothetical protein [Actinoplanes sp. L3-i22]|uniref:hypothetical protein n=1 Tax=Actinoplanes sp. L3-i22 TaxID=2836373 RepID=UPI001C751804|nr:hypothetical protein [Actinoplanes sp. L3-i22]BCY09300.1 hypothetical protein L3i22_043880 [Actinoplanes sp. L3-i22]
MWQPLRDIITSAKEALGIEVPGADTVTDAVTGAGDQAADAITTATGAAGDAADAAGTASEAAAETGEQITSKLTGFLDRFGG